jgi:hypothetical protein
VAAAKKRAALMAAVALELSKRAGIEHEYVYNLVRYDQLTLPADVVRKVAKAMSLPRSWLSTQARTVRRCTAAFYILDSIGH